MTKFQRGELMEGWNDCPVPVPPPGNSSASASSSVKSRRRVSRMPIVGNAGTPGNQAGFPSVSSLPNSSESSASLSSRSLAAPPVTPPVLTGLPPPARGPPRVAQTEPSAGVEVDSEETETSLRGLVESAPIADREKEFLTKRLVEVFPALDPQHKQFIAHVVQGLLAKEPTTTLKTQVLNYMMTNSGVSMWGSPLKKLVESLK